MKVTQPHDRFVKAVLADPIRALDVLNFTLKQWKPENPPRVTQLRREDSGLVTHKLKQVTTDLLFSSFTQKGTKEFTLLFEHKSFRDRAFRIQLIRYMGELMETPGKSLRAPPPVVPLVLYHGKESWTKEARTSDTNQVKEWLKDFCFETPYLYLDLSSIDKRVIESEFKQNVYVKTILLTLKYIFWPRKLERTLLDVLNLNSFDSREGRDFLNQLFVYLYSVLEQGHYKIIKRLAEALEQNLRRNIMTLAESLRVEGRVEGCLENQRKTLIMLLSKKFKVNSYEKNFIRGIKSAEKLDKALEAVLGAKTKEEVLDLLE